jgi:hypothetical protein
MSMITAPSAIVVIVPEAVREVEERMDSYG